MPSPSYGKAVHQGVDGLTVILVGSGGQMCVSGGCQDADVAEDFLQFNEINTGFE